MVAPDIYGADGETTTKGVRSELGIQRDGRYTRQEPLPATRTSTPTPTT